MAREKAKDIYGPTANAVNVTNHTDRNQRFGVVMTEPGGIDRNPVLVVLGHGSSYEAAFAHAEQNPAAQMAASRISEIKKAFESGAFADPQKYVDEVLKKQLEEKINGTNSASE